jgi:MFS family permease
MLDWYKVLTVEKRKAFWAAYGGWAMDAMDLQIFSFLVPSLIAAWGITRADAGVLGTVVLIASAIGGWIGGIVSDRIGRVRTMQITILWYSIFTFLSGFTQNYEQLLVVRSLQGIGFGAEWAAGAVLIGEIVLPEHRGKALGFLQGGYALGWAAAALVSSFVLSMFPSELAWRAAFWIGIFPAVITFLLRRGVSEPEIFIKAFERAKSQGTRFSAVTIFKSTYLARTICACLMATGFQGAVLTLLTWLPSFLKMERGLSGSSAGSYIVVVTIGAFFGYAANGYLSDSFGRRPCILSFCAACLLLLLAYTYVPMSNSAMLFLGLPLGFFSFGNFGSLAAYLTELFPTEIRANGQAFSSSVGRGFGGLFVAITGYLSDHVFSLGEAVGLMALTGYGVAALAVLLLPETCGSTLSSIDEIQYPESVMPAESIKSARSVNLDT